MFHPSWNDRALASLDRWLTTPPDEDFDDTHFDYYRIALFDNSESDDELVSRTFKRMLNEDEIDIVARATEWAVKWCSDNGLSYDDVVIVDEYK